MHSFDFTPEGPLNARIALIGESLGKNERALRRPFMGYSGNLLKRWWALPSINLTRESIYIDNLIPYMPTQPLEAISLDELHYWRNQLWQRLSALTNLAVIVPTGNFASWATCGIGKCKATAEKENNVGITSMRGSIYSSIVPLHGRTVKTIPTLHPSHVLRAGGDTLGNTSSTLEKHSVRDWERIAYEANFFEIREPTRTFVIDPMETEVRSFTECILSDPSLLLSVDIETWGRTLNCVGFSHDPSYAICIPTGTVAQKRAFFPYIKQLLEGQNEKIFQNGLYDNYWLACYNFRVNNWLWDTLCMHHALDATDTHDLAYLCSYYLPYYRYWKDEAKEAEEIIKFARNAEQVWRYNCQDSSNTRELFNYLLADLRSEGMLEFYLRHYSDMFAPLLDTSLHGFRIDRKQQAKLHADYEQDCARIRELLATRTGEDLFAKKDFSRSKLLRFFHETLNLPKMTKMRKRADGSKEKTTALDSIALAKLAHMYPEKCGDIVKMIVEHRHKAKVKNTWLVPSKLDKDERVRCSYGFSTEAGRLNSNTNPTGSGFNLQNVDRNIREIFLPDEF